MADLSTSKALEVFLKGFGAARSYTSPYLVSHPSPNIWLLSDPPDANRKVKRSAEMVAYHSTAEEIITVRNKLALNRHSLCILLDEAADDRHTVNNYKNIGYRAIGREPLFILHTAARIRHTQHDIRRIVTACDADLIAKAARYRQILRRFLTEENSECRLYAAFENGTPVGWVRSIRTHDDCAWVSNLYVKQEFRRRGIALSLMTSMLDDDEKYGVAFSVLLSSITGSFMYPALGYEQRGLLLIFSPAKTL